MASEFVTLLHTGYGPAHWDVMISRGSALATWQAPADPADLAPGQAMAVRRLPDHRSAYLTYEGPVRGGRGEVRRVHHGLAAEIRRDPTGWLLRLEGQACPGRFELRQAGPEPQLWSLKRIQ